MISIIIPVYNSEAYIHQCLESIINQTFKNFEVILVDDGSTDGSLDILKYYSNKYENICYLTQNNKGAGAARNLALNNCKGEYIVYVDSDDYLEATYLEEMISKVKETDSDIVICGYNSVYEDIEADTVENLPYNTEKDVISGKEAAELVLNYKIDGFLWNKIFKKERMIKFAFMLEEGKNIEDFYPVFKQLSLSDRISFVNKTLYNYRQRLDSTMHKITVPRLKDYCNTINEIVIYSENYNLNIKKINYFKAISFIILINDYYYTYGKVKNDFYRNFKRYKLDDFKPSLLSILVNNEVSIKNKIIFILWSAKIYRFIKEMKK